MSIKTIKNLTTLLPELAPMVKAASLEKEFPTGNTSETLISALEIKYMEKIAGQIVDFDTLQRVNKAVSLYGLQDSVNAYVSQMTKVAAETEDNEGMVREYLRGIHVDFEKVAEACATIYDSKGSISDDLAVYAGKGFLDKEAAVNAINWRYAQSGEEGFQKVASFIEDTDIELDVSQVRALAGLVRTLEKKAGIYGRCFEKEAFTIRKSDDLIRLGRKMVAYSVLTSRIDTIRSVLGDDVAEAVEAGPAAVSALDKSQRDIMGDIV